TLCVGMRFLPLRGAGPNTHWWGGNSFWAAERPNARSHAERGDQKLERVEANKRERPPGAGRCSERPQLLVPVQLRYAGFRFWRGPSRSADQVDGCTAQAPRTPSRAVAADGVAAVRSSLDSGEASDGSSTAPVRVSGSAKQASDACSGMVGPLR